MTSSPDVKKNLAFIEQALVNVSAEVKGQVVVLPECFACFGGREHANTAIAEKQWQSNAGAQPINSELSETPVQDALSKLAIKFGIYLVAGTFPIQDETSDKVKPMCLVYSPQGYLISTYQKIHLFDVDVGDNTGSYRESDTWQAGNQVSYFETPWGRIGLAICYDVRFPALFQQLTKLGCKAIVLPSAFTQKTGSAHWQILVQARAIENQVYMIACNQTGTHKNQRQTFGHSLVVDPWGEILSDAKTELGIFGAEMNLDKLQQVRRAMPLQQHNQFSVELISKDQD
ncbi:MAG: carbon-nitrogen hydrolase family protein [Gammaproteobacteria bacterium]|nr:carbon-nitrogen hydrolase family protein [Gammaproteobacteria bacterium]